MRFYSFLIFIILSLFLFSCRKDKLLTDSSAKLEFSKDTLTFDTVFSTIGSATRYFIVYNNNNKPIKVSDIHLAGGISSSFRLNIDGEATNSVKDVEIAANDSLYIFAAVTVDPGNTNNPFVLEDSVVFETNGNHQRVLLQAWGQDAHFFRDGVISTDQTWTNDKPYVIINSGKLKFGLFIDTAVTLTINPGCKIYSHPGAYIFVAGTLKVGGAGDSVTFQGDRLERYFQDLPGGWGGIWFLKTSKNNVIENAVIRDGTVGIRVDSLSDNHPVAKLVLKRTIIKNMLNAGLLAFTSTIIAENCLIFNIGAESCIELILGGIYDFKNCTFANYGSVVINHQKPVAYISNYYAINNKIHGIGDLGVDFSNCIIYGSLEKELSLESVPDAQFVTNFNSCCIKSSDAISGNNIIKSDPMFADISKDNFHLSAGSPCINAGAASGVTVDLDNKPRDANIDIGAYEYQ